MQISTILYSFNIFVSYYKYLIPIVSRYLFDKIFCDYLLLNKILYSNTLLQTHTHTIYNISLKEN